MNGKHSRILMAAKDVFESKGFHDAKIAEIAVQADVGKGTVYEYFDSKQNLFEEMILFIMEAGFNHMNRLIDEKDDPIEKLRVIADIETEIIKEHGQLFSVVIERMYSASDELKSKFIETRIYLLDKLQEILEEGIEKKIFKEISSKHFAYIFKGALTQANMSENCHPMGLGEVGLKDELFDILIASIKL